MNLPGHSAGHQCNTQRLALVGAGAWRQILPHTAVTCVSAQATPLKTTGLGGQWGHDKALVASARIAGAWCTPPRPDQSAASSTCHTSVSTGFLKALRACYLASAVYRRGGCGQQLPAWPLRGARRGPRCQDDSLLLRKSFQAVPASKAMSGSNRDLTGCR